MFTQSDTNENVYSLLLLLFSFVAFREILIVFCCSFVHPSFPICFFAYRCRHRRVSEEICGESCCKPIAESAA